MEYLFATLYVLIAAAVTAHVLLTRSDVRAVMAWIAVAWLSPFLGGFLYFAFGINRVTRRAVHLDMPERPADGSQPPDAKPDVPDNIGLLAEAGARVTGSPLIAGNAVAVFHGGDEAYPVMLDAIRNAKHSVALASYIFRHDVTGRAFVAALNEAHARGVAVRVLIDSVGSGYFHSGTLNELADGGVPAARFLHTWLPWRMPFLNMRNHKKLLIVDGRIGFTGGLNIGADHSRRLMRSRSEYIDDVQVRVEGPVVRQLLQTFSQDWSFTTGEDLTGEAWWPAMAQTGSVFARGIHSGPDADIYKLETILGAALAQARSRVRIVTPYFLPDQRIEFAIAQAGLRGVEVQILLPGRSDHVFMDWAVRAHLRFFKKVPAAVYFTAAPFNHAKLMTIDGEWCLTGSSNWDTRSFRLNFEFDLECYDRELTAKIDAVIDRKLAQCSRVDLAALAAAPRPIRLRDAATRLLLPYL